MLAARLAEALERGEIVSHFQPIYAVDGSLRHLEALARWIRPDGFSISPGDFIPVAEAGGMADALTRTMMTGVRDLLGSPGVPDDLRVFLNVTTSQLQTPAFDETMIAQAEAAGIDPRRLGLEINEAAAVTDPRRISHHLDRIRDAGMAVAIDDFGAGYSPLGLLFDLPVDMLKSERSLVRQVDNDSARSKLAVGLIRAFSEAGLELVAVGVERTEERSRLVDAGIDYLQGYLLARPQDHDRVIATMPALPVEPLGA